MSRHRKYRKHGLLVRLLKAVGVLLAACLLLVLLLKWVPVPATPLMLKRSLSRLSDKDFRTNRIWVSLDNISPDMVMAVIASEDNLFDEHNGFDIEEIKKMRESHIKKHTAIRGCSTISQQTAKNCFTWCSSTWVRKGFEAGWTVLIEKIWGKRRIMEVYLNVVELGDGIYGVEAASRHYFGVSASRLTASQAASLAYCLPAPLKRNPAGGTAYLKKRRAEIMSLMQKVARPDWLPGNGSAGK